MKIHWQGKRYASPEEMKQEVRHELLIFLEEWFDDRPYVSGHTSGSTGAPKEIRLNKADMRASARLTNAFLGICSSSVLLLCLSTSYIAGKMMVVRALEADADLVAGEVTSRPLKNLEGVFDLAAMVPMQVEESLKYPEDRERVAGIRQILIGGAPVLPELERKLSRLPAVCYATYGMTETVSHVALRELGKQEEYFALGKVTFAADERGCLVISAPHLQAGKFVTNDLVDLTDDRHFRWLGRYDHAINSGGMKFLPERIENRIAACFSRRFFITALPDERLGQRMVLVLEGEPAGEEAEARLKQALGKILASYELPKEILYRRRFEETASGKVIRRL